jgi:hypothetical protein
MVQLDQTGVYGLDFGGDLRALLGFFLQNFQRDKTENRIRARLGKEGDGSGVLGLQKVAALIEPGYLAAQVWTRIWPEMEAHLASISGRF